MVKFNLQVFEWGSGDRQGMLVLGIYDMGIVLCSIGWLILLKVGYYDDKGYLYILSKFLLNRVEMICKQKGIELFCLIVRIMINYCLLFCDVLVGFDRFVIMVKIILFL